MRGSCDVQPLRRGTFFRAKQISYTVGQNFSSTARNRLKSRRFESTQNFFDAQARNVREVLNFNARETFDVKRGKFRVQSLDERQIILESPSRVQSADDVQSDKIRVAACFGDKIDRLVKRHCVSFAVVGISPESTELATRHTNIGQIHVTVDVVQNFVAAKFLAHEIRQCTEPTQFVAGKQSFAVGMRQPFAAQNFAFDNFKISRYKQNTFHSVHDKVANILTQAENFFAARVTKLATLTKSSTTKLAAISTTRQPSATLATRQPSAISATRQPSAISTTRQPSAISATRQPSATSATRQPSATSATERQPFDRKIFSHVRKISCQN